MLIFRRVLKSGHEISKNMWPHYKSTMFHTLRIMDYEANKVVEIVETNELRGDFTYF